MRKGTEKLGVEGTEAKVSRGARMVLVNREKNNVMTADLHNQCRKQRGREGTGTKSIARL